MADWTESDAPETDVGKALELLRSHPEELLAAVIDAAARDDNVRNALVDEFQSEAVAVPRAKSGKMQIIWNALFEVFGRDDPTNSKNVGRVITGLAELFRSAPGMLLQVFLERASLESRKAFYEYQRSVHGDYMRLLEGEIRRRRGRACESDCPRTGRGDAAGASWIVRGPGRGDAAGASWIVRGRVAATPRGASQRRRVAASPRRRRVAAPPPRSI